MHSLEFSAKLHAFPQPNRILGPSRPRISFRKSFKLNSSSLNKPEPSSDAAPVNWLIPSLSSIGAVETAYLTIEKLTGADVVCPTLSLDSAASSTCGDVLNSSWSTLFGVPLSLIGCIAYLSVGLLSFEPFKGQDLARWTKLCITTAMAATSSFLMYILFTQWEGATCQYCLLSAGLSAGLWLATLSSFKSSDVKAVTVSQTALLVGVILGLSFGFDSDKLAYAGADFLPPVSPAVVTESSADALSIAERLRLAGAKVYGAFWCSHCNEQKQLLGREAMQRVQYVECFPDGWRRGVPLAPACEAAGIQGFPTWQINGQLYPGEQSIAELEALLESS